jgi:hypothetical protein
MGDRAYAKCMGDQSVAERPEACISLTERVPSLLRVSCSPLYCTILAGEIAALGSFSSGVYSCEPCWNISLAALLRSAFSTHGC